MAQGGERWTKGYAIAVPLDHLQVCVQPPLTLQPVAVQVAQTTLLVPHEKAPFATSGLPVHSVGTQKTATGHQQQRELQYSMPMGKQCMPCSGPMLFCYQQARPKACYFACYRVGSRSPWRPLQRLLCALTDEGAGAVDRRPAASSLACAGDTAGVACNALPCAHCGDWQGAAVEGAARCGSGVA